MLATTCRRVGLKLNLELSPGLVVTYAIVQPVPAGNGLKVTLVFGSRLRLGGFRIVEGRRGPVLLPPAVKTAGGKWVSPTCPWLTARGSLRPSSRA